MTVLVDTGAWYALADASDRHHVEARAYYESVAGREELVTTDAILVETWVLLTSHLGRRAALAFWDGLREMGLSVLCLEPVDLEAAWRIACAYPDQDFSFTDCTTFALMERMGISRAFAFDSHFLIYRYGPRRDRVFTRFP
ncbi:MAG: PIN domain-containing protein [Clostridia bacterium]|nr:PIN domain-containing protein [Clostridia bacterium]